MDFRRVSLFGKSHQIQICLLFVILFIFFRTRKWTPSGSHWIRRPPPPRNASTRSPHSWRTRRHQRPSSSTARLEFQDFVCNFQHAETLNQAFFWTFRKKTQAQKKLKTQEKSWKNSSEIPKKLRNRQLQLSWVGAKLNENSIFKGKT